MIELKNVSKYYHDKAVLKNINLVLPKKGLIFIIGVSGSGKTTLLNLLGGLEHPTNGTINVQGLKLHNLSKRELECYRRYYVSFIFQQYNLLPKMTVLDNINLLNYQKLDPNIWDLLNLKVLPEQKVATLSGGEAQRIAIARSLASRHEIILADEPTGALDSATSDAIMGLFKSISRTKLVLVVTHNEALAQKYGDEILHMVDGTIKSSRHKTKTGNILKLPKYKSMPLQKLLKIVLANYRSNFKRNIMTSIALSVGLLALFLALALAQGFKDSLQRYEYDYAKYYPLYLSLTSSNMTESFEDFASDDDFDSARVYVEKDAHVNNIDRRFMSFVRELKSDTNYQVYTYLIDDNIIFTTPKSDEEQFYDTLEILAGKFSSKRDEVMLLLDCHNRLNATLAHLIGLESAEYTAEELINYEYVFNNITYKITGVVRGLDDSYFFNTSAIIYKIDNFSNELPEEIYLFPQDYFHKENIIAKIHKYDANFTYTDYTDTFKSAFTTIFDAVRIVLISFAGISLIVATMLMGLISYLGINEHRHDIGLFKSLGISYREVKFIFLLENQLIAIVSSIMATLAAVILTIPLNLLLSHYIGFEDVLTLKFGIFGLVLAISLILSMIGSYIPLHHIDKMNIVSLLKDNN